MLPPHPTRSGPVSALFQRNFRVAKRISSLRNFYAWGIIAYRRHGAKRDSAMRTFPKSRACEVYSVSGYGHCSAVGSPAQVREMASALTALFTLSAKTGGDKGMLFRLHNQSNGLCRYRFINLLFIMLGFKLLQLLSPYISGCAVCAGSPVMDMSR